MRKGIFAVLPLFLALYLMSCAGSSQLAVADATATPKPVAPGKNVTLHVTVKGPTKNVDRVETTVREYPDFRGQLTNDGQNGDTKAGDNVWSTSFQVPYDAPAGTYHVDVSVYDTNGNEVVTKALENQWTGKSATIEVVVQ